MADLTCVECGSALTGQQTKICGKDCERKRLRKSEAYKAAKDRYRDKHRKGAKHVPAAFTCAWCAKECVPGKNVGAMATRFCSIVCKRQVLNTEWNRKDARKRKAKSDLKRAAAGTSGQKAWIAGYCPRCGVAVVRRRTGGPHVADGTYCSLRCNRRDGADKAKVRRRMRESLTRIESVSRNRVFERDGFRCQLCNGKLSMANVVPHPKAPTIDHIVPLSCGGEHVYENLQAAHFECNHKKGAGGVDQLRLIG